MIKTNILLLSLVLVLPACGSESDSRSTESAATFDAFFPKEIDVFGVSIRGTSTTPDGKMLHAAHIMAEYLDNDADGEVDNPLVVEAMQTRNATLVMTLDRDELDEFPFEKLPPGEFQDQNAAETIPGGRERGVFDASLEEVLHLITHVGYANAYPDVFGEFPGTVLANAMDIARGGHFKSIPEPYPEDAWYSYDDTTCDYSCMATEYLYWAITTKLGAQDFPGRREQIEHEWRPNSAEELAARDEAIYALLSDPAYKLPTVLPTGNYQGGEITFERR